MKLHPTTQVRDLLLRPFSARRFLNAIVLDDDHADPLPPASTE